MKVLVCGGREFDDWRMLNDTLNDLVYELPEDHKPICIIQGGANGADFLAKVWAKFRLIAFEEYKANWAVYGPKAGFLRNKQMLDEGKPNLVIAFPGGRGTANMVKQAREAGVEVREIK